ncbi:carboxylesterase/lipase family protein [Amycolatopsis sp. cmx-11-51]|uniref:carboxylesterase/lipase family protein n=1 Tax=Amycolatopsis sp. cmx-11-51 TaxID=2785797 RepID=UPI0039E31FD2
MRRVTTRRRLATALLLAATTVGSTACTNEAAADPTHMHTGSGELRGVRDNDIVRFRGVPYAEPPTGSQRWAPPKPVRPWDGVREASAPGPPCAQAGNPPEGSTAEDCLYLDITVPANSATVRRPVLVWLHGGGFSSGAGTEYDPRRLAVQGDVVVATVDFRLNIFGNLALPGMTDGGSYGLQDQQAALAWLRRNAAAFGGDPGNITLFGQSGGAVAICGQLTSPAARGLFSKAILQSGSCHTTLAANASGPESPAFGAFWRPKAQAERSSAQAAAALGCPPGGDQLGCLRALPVDKLLTQAGTATAATVGGTTLPVDPRDGLKQALDVPVLSGNTADEQRTVAGVYELLGKPITAAQYPELLAKGFGAAAVQQQYPLRDYPTPGLAWAAVYTDSGFACPQQQTDTALAARGPVFGYRFADPTAPPLIPVPPTFQPGASHASELFYLFDVKGKPVHLDGSTYPLTAAQQQLAERMIAAWSTFAHTGNPGHTRTADQWPAWDPAAPKVHEFTADADRPSTVDPAAAHQCGFWSSLH